MENTHGGKLELTDAKKRNLAIVYKFLKETKLFGLWTKYVYSEEYSFYYGLFLKHDNVCVEDVLGNTNFTNFVTSHLREKFNDDNLYSETIYILFVHWLLKLGLDTSYNISSKTIDYMQRMESRFGSSYYNIEFDKDGKTAKIFFKSEKGNIVKKYYL